jgi:sulfane dehydrogenase subunit SoxC
LHIKQPIGDSAGTITATSLHYFATTKGGFVPDIDPAQHTLMIDGLVDRPRVFTMADLKRFPSVTKFHFVECTGNTAAYYHKDVQQTSGNCSNSEWTGVLLSTLLNEVGVQDKAQWVITEGAEEVKGAQSIPMAKAMDDLLIAYAQNGEPVRPQNGFPLRAVVPGFEGIFNTKWLRHIKAVEQYQLNMNDFGHIDNDEIKATLGMTWGPKGVITFPSGSQKLPGPGWYEITGLAWSGQGAVTRVEVSTDGGLTWTDADLKGTPYPRAHTRFGLMWNWDGGAHTIMSRTTDDVGQVQPTRQQIAEFFKVPYSKTWSPPGANNTIMPWIIGTDGSVINGIV